MNKNILTASGSLAGNPRAISIMPVKIIEKNNTRQNILSFIRMKNTFTFYESKIRKERTKSLAYGDELYFLLFNSVPEEYSTRTGLLDDSG